MPVLNTQRKLRGSKRDDIQSQNTMIEINNTENNALLNVDRSNSHPELEPQTLTRNAVDEQIKNHNVLSIAHQKDLTRLIQGILGAHQVQNCPTASISASFGIAGTSFDTSAFLVISIFRNVKI